MKTRVYWSWIGAVALGLGAPVAHAQDDEAGPATRAQLTRQLNEQVNILARNPHDFRALFGAARIALSLGDISAAEGFYRRAEERAPGDYRIKQGLAAIALRRGQPRIAMALFEEADELGAPEDSAASDRGLALDLLGDQKGAQRLYEKAIENDEGDDEAVRRLALSFAITGDARKSERTLRPLMSRRDRAAYRTRAFALASMGRTDDAVTVAEAMLPPAQAARMEPYLRYVPRLSPAQKAAAGNLGLFPRVANLGAAPREEVSGAAQADQRSEGSRLVPTGEPLGNSEPPRQAAQTNIQPVEVAAAQQAEPAQGAEMQAGGDASPDLAEARPGFDLVSASTARQAPSGPAIAEEEPVELSEAFAGFTLPAGDDGSVGGAGAVDISSFEPPREKPEPESETAKLEKEHPRRFWVQVATGRDRSALAFDWRRIRRSAGDLLSGYDGHLASWNATNRLLAGPYRSEKAAQDVVTQLKGKGVDSFPFTSDAGEEVTPIGAR